MTNTRQDTCKFVNFMIGEYIYVLLRVLDGYRKRFFNKKKNILS